MMEKNKKDINKEKVCGVLETLLLLGALLLYLLHRDKKTIQERMDMIQERIDSMKEAINKYLKKA
jgi:hypothetical protein